MYYYKLHVTGELEEIEIDRRMELKDYYREIDCDCISYVMCVDNETNMIIDDEGKLKEKQVNFLATLLYGALPYDVINGDVLLCTTKVINEIGEKDFYGYEESQIEYFKGLIKEVLAPLVSM